LGPTQIGRAFQRTTPGDPAFGPVGLQDGFNPLRASESPFNPYFNLARFGVVQTPLPQPSTPVLVPRSSPAPHNFSDQVKFLRFLKCSSPARECADSDISIGTYDHGRDGCPPDPRELLPRANSTESLVSSGALLEVEATRPMTAGPTFDPHHLLQGEECGVPGKALATFNSLPILLPRGTSACEPSTPVHGHMLDEKVLSYIEEPCGGAAAALDEACLLDFGDMSSGWYLGDMGSIGPFGLDAMDFDTVLSSASYAGDSLW
jgi:hypothetical protein